MMWVYIIYHNIFNQNNINAEPLHILFNENKKYIMIDILDIIDSNLIQILFNILNYLNECDSILDYPLLVIPYNYINYITFNKMITGVLHKSNDKFELVPFKTTITSKTIKGEIIYNKFIDINEYGIIDKNELDNLYLKKIYNYKIDNNIIPIYILLNQNTDIKVSMKIFS